MEQKVLDTLCQRRFLWQKNGRTSIIFTCIFYFIFFTLWQFSASLLSQLVDVLTLAGDTKLGDFVLFLCSREGLLPAYGFFCFLYIEDWYYAADWPLPTPPVSTVCPLSASTEASSCLKTKEHDVLQRQRVVDLWKDGKSEGSIGQELRMPKSTVHSIIVKYRLSNTVENLPRNGRPKKPWPERDKVTVEREGERG